jgi:hypothetical protein
MGFLDDKATRDLTDREHQWQHIFDWLADIAPQHTWEPLFAALFITETQIAEEEVEALWKKNEQEDKAEQEPTECDELERTQTLVARVINQWTTIPVFTEEMWQAATQTGPDLKLVLEALQNETPLLPT